MKLTTSLAALLMGLAATAATGHPPPCDATWWSDLPERAAFNHDASSGFIEANVCQRPHEQRQG